MSAVSMLILEIAFIGSIVFAMRASLQFVHELGAARQARRGRKQAAQRSARLLAGVLERSRQADLTHTTHTTEES